MDDAHFCFVWQDAALDEGEFLKATYLELKTDKTEEMKQKILAFAVKKLDVPDAHLYFQAPGGQVFRLAGIDEDLSLYEDHLHQYLDRPRRHRRCVNEKQRPPKAVSKKRKRMGYEVLPVFGSPRGTFLE